MIDFELSKQMEMYFEKYMFQFYTKFKRFSLEDFGNFASTILNFYVNNNIIEHKSKKAYAYFLATLYNRGIGNRISEEHLQLISQTISNDSSSDFTVIQELFG